ncbi:TIGR01244 family sulfur transferase [Litoreibacter sp.]|nr:TIGR01244 family sulfur transferase [Litoreibacter sp.]
MDIRPLTPDFAVAPQITAEDVNTLKAEGFTHIICNRPAFESAPDETPDVIAAAVAQAGMGWTDNPMMGGQLSMEMIQAQRAEGKVLAYCASGTRSAILWGLAQAGEMPTDDILKAMRDAGYPMEQMRGQLDMLASQNGAA